MLVRRLRTTERAGPRMAGRTDVRQGLEVPRCHPGGITGWVAMALNEDDCSSREWIAAHEQAWRTRSNGERCTCGLVGRGLAEGWLRNLGELLWLARSVQAAEALEQARALLARPVGESFAGAGGMEHKNIAFGLRAISVASWRCCDGCGASSI